MKVELITSVALSFEKEMDPIERWDKMMGVINHEVLAMIVADKIHRVRAVYVRPNKEVQTFGGSGEPWPIQYEIEVGGYVDMVSHATESEVGSES